MKKALIAFVLLVTAVSCMDLNGTVSGYFRLGEDSPLPVWVVLPKGINRDQVSVEITIYEATTTASWKVRFVVLNKRRWIFREIQEEMGSGYWHPDSLKNKNPGGTYPNWMTIEVNGAKEVYEQSEANDLLKIVKRPVN